MILAALVIAMFIGIGMIVYGYLMEVQAKTIENLPLMMREHLK